MRRPSFQFYPADWRKDMALQSCSVAARGLWMDLLCIAHECEPYGHLVVNGKPMNAAQIGRHTGLTQRECERLLSELHESGVSSTTVDGIIFSRRMVRDEDLRNRRAEGGQAGAEHGIKGGKFGGKGGRPKTPRGVSEPPLKPAPSSSASSSSSDELSKPSASHPSVEGFAEFWLAWPKNERKQDKAACQDLWKRRGYEAISAAILADVRVKRGTEKWAEGYIEAPLVYLRNKRWEDGVTPNSEADNEDLGDWRKDRKTVEAKGIAVGLGKWDQYGFEHGEHQETFAAYEARVAARVEELEGAPS